MIREITENDYQQLMVLYTHLHETTVPKLAGRAADYWKRINSDPDYHIIVAEIDGKIAASCTCIIIPNMTHGAKPYAFVENVVTHADYRKRGLATMCLDRAKQIAEQCGCYKIFLMTGSKLESTLNFYERAGYERNTKTAFYMPLNTDGE
ncbi:MAG: GNAT family N-acetyltransferase [Oscillospiraceae bacterium]